MAVASIGLVGSAVALGRAAFGLRTTTPERVEEADVELVVRERLYGPRERAPRA